MNAALNAWLSARMMAVQIPQPVLQEDCEHRRLTVVRSAGTAQHEELAVHCNRCGAGLMATFGEQDPVQLRPMTALELCHYGEGPRHFTAEES